MIAVIITIIPANRSNAPQMNKSIEADCIDGPCLRNAEAASPSASPSIKTIIPTIISPDLDIHLRSFDFIAINKIVRAERRFRPIFIQNAGTAFSGAAPGNLSALTDGITPDIRTMAMITITTEQTSSIRWQVKYLTFIIPPGKINHYLLRLSPQRRGDAEKLWNNTER